MVAGTAAVLPAYVIEKRNSITATRENSARLDSRRRKFVNSLRTVTQGIEKSQTTCMIAWISSKKRALARYQSIIYSIIIEYKILLDSYL